MTKTVIGVILAASVSNLVWAEPRTAPLTWTECIQIAARHNPDLRAALLDVESRRADYRGSYNGILPQISLSNSYRESETSGVNSGGSWNAQMSASLNLIDASEWASIQSSLASYHQSEASRKLAASTTLLDLYRAFSGLLYAQDAIHVNEAIRDIWKRNAQMVSLRYQSGRESKGNAMNTDAQRLQADTSVEQALRDRSAALTQLRQVLGEEPFTVTAVTGTWTAEAASTKTPDFDAMVNALPQVLVQQAAVDIARAKVRSAQSSIYPALSLNYTKGTTGSTEFPKDPFWTFSGVVSLPIFGGGPTSTYYANQSAQRAYDKARETLRSVKNQARVDLETAWAAFMEAQDQVRVQDAFLAAAAQRKAESDIRYQSGLMSFEDWNRVVSDYVSFQTSNLRARQNRVVAEAQWRYSQGESI